MGLNPTVVHVCVCACEYGPCPSGHGEQSRALSNHSLLSKDGQEGKGSCEDLPMISLLSKSESRTSLVMCFEKKLIEDRVNRKCFYIFFHTRSYMCMR